MRIGYLFTKFPTLSETFVLREVEELARQGFDIAPYSLKPVPASDLVDDTMRAWHRRTTYVPAPWAGQTLGAAVGIAARKPGTTARSIGDSVRSNRTLWRAQAVSLAVIAQAAWVARHADRAGIDRFHSHFAGAAATVAWAVGRWTGKPFSFTPHAGELFTTWFRDGLLRHKAREAEFVVAISEYNRRYLREVSGYADDHFPLVRYGLPSSYFTEPTPTAKTDRPLVLSVGRLVPKKGHRYLIEAIERLAAKGLPVRCEIVGEGPLRGELQALIDGLGMRDRIVLRGALPQPEVRALLDEATVFCLSAIVADDGDRDGLPNVLIEAMARGLPTVSTDVTGVPELITHGRSGVIVSQRNAEELASALADLLEDEAARASLGRNGRAVAMEQFSIETEAARLGAAFLGTRPAAGAR